MKVAAIACVMSSVSNALPKKDNLWSLLFNKLEKAGLITFQNGEDIVNDLVSYGCHCNMEEQPGKGVPIDEMDMSCRMWTKCRQCATIDSSNGLLSGGGQCDWKNTVYEVKFLEDSNELDCVSQGDDCKEIACQCDNQLTSSIVDMFQSGGFDNLFSTLKGFDFPGLCVGSGPGNGGDRGEIQCCGSYPQRFHFFTGSDDTRKCCGSKTYSSNTHTCCDDNVSLLGEC